MIEDDYDAYPYQARAQAESHVSRLALLATLWSLSPTPPSRCRVLEIGCADGGNLIPMAAEAPESSFVGVDLSLKQIAAARDRAERWSVKNIQFLHADATTLPDDLGQFDYVIMHGVYSWVPEPVQARLLKVVAARLRPHGVAYVSYDTLPGWHGQRVVRDFVLRHAAHESPEELAQSARALIQFLGSAVDPDTAYGRSIQARCEALLGASGQYLIHGLLSAEHHPCYFLDFLEAAQRWGLVYLADADPRSLSTDTLHPSGRRAIAQVPGTWLDHEEIRDVLTERSFRRSLLVHGEGASRRDLDHTAIEGMHVASRGGPSIGDPMWDAALGVLAAVWPSSIPVATWLDQTENLVGHGLRAALYARALAAFAAGILELRLTPVAACRVAGERPCASRWARAAARDGVGVTDLRHQPRELPELMRVVLAACDGQTSRLGLASAARAAGLGMVHPEQIDAALAGLAARSLLIA